MTTFLIFDIEGIVDVNRMLRVEGSGLLQGETRDRMIEREMKRICDMDPLVKAGTKECFPPPRYHGPTTICMLLVDDHMNHLNHAAINFQVADPSFPKALSPDFKKNTETFWNTVKWAKETYPGLCLVTFGGRNYDLPVLEATALEHGIQLPNWFVFNEAGYKDPRSNWNEQFHLDLSAYLGKGNKGGSLSFFSRLVGLPGKQDSNGSMVADMLKKMGGNELVRDYCSCDVLLTYGLLFSVLHCAGDLPAGYRGNPIFEDTMNKCIAGLGQEAQGFKTEYELAMTALPF